MKSIELLESKDLDPILNALFDKGFEPTDRRGRTWENKGQAAFVSAVKDGFAVVIFKKDPILELNCVRFER